MKRDTRGEILAVAKALFNEKGFNEVGIRDIAQALGISNGNVTYHFKKKEDMVEALLFQEEGAGEGPKNREAPRTLEELGAFIFNMQQVVQENAFYFWHYTQLSQLSPQIHAGQKERYRQNALLLGEAFRALHGQGLMRGEGFGGEYETVIDALLLASVYWIPFGKLKNEEPGSYQAHAWGLIHGLLTEKGREYPTNTCAIP